MARASWGLSLILAATTATAQDPQLISKVHPSRISDTALGTRGVASADGRYVAFLSPGLNLVAGQIDEAEADDLFLRDRLSGQTTLVSHVTGAPLTAAGVTGAPFISADGAYVLFESYATNLVGGGSDANDGFDIFLWERASNRVQLVSHRAGEPTVAANVGFSYAFALSEDGRFVLLGSRATDVVAGQSDVNGALDLFLWDRVTQTTTLVSHVPGAPATTGSAFTDFGGLSAGAEYVVFESQAEDLVPGQVDAYATSDVFLFQRSSGEIRLVSHGRDYSTEARGGGDPVVSRDGRYVAFVSRSPDLVPGQIDLNRQSDVFLYDVAADSIKLVSHRPDHRATTGNDSANSPRLSADGARVLFVSYAGDLGPGIQDDNGVQDVFLFERATATVSVVSGAAGTTRTGNKESSQAVLSPDGRQVAFVSRATDLVPGQIDLNLTEDTFLYDIPSATMRLASHRPSLPLVAGTSVFAPVLAADGTVVLFVSHTRDLTEGIPHGAISRLDVFALEVATDAVTAVSVRDPGLPALTAGGAFHRAHIHTVSDDGRYVVFSSFGEDLLPGLSRVSGANIFLYDRQAGSLRLVSHRPGEPTAAANHSSYLPTISGDGRFVAYASYATDLVPNQVNAWRVWGIFLFDATIGENTLVSRRTGLPSEVANNESWTPAISADGRFVAFRSLATDLVAGQRESRFGLDVFLYDHQSGSVSMVSHRFDAPAHGSGACTDVFLCDDTMILSRDGSFVAYTSAAVDIVAGQADGNGGQDVFLYERATRINRLASRSVAGAALAGNGAAAAPAFSGDGRYLAFSSRATDHVPGQQDMNGGEPDVFVYDRLTGSIVLASRATGSLTRTGSGASTEPALDGNGSTVVFASLADDLVPGLVGPSGPQVFAFEPGSGRTTLVSHRPLAPLQRANGASGTARLSADGRRVAYESSAVDLVPGQQDADADSRDVFLYDRVTALTTLAGHLPGEPGRVGNRVSEFPNLSADGTTLAFESQASDLAPGDFNYIVSPSSGGTLPIFGGWDIFVLRFNAAPTALRQAVTLGEDTSRPIMLSGSDADGDALTYTLASPAQHGTVSGTPPSVTYTPLPDYHGPDQFTFTVSDGRESSSPGAVDLTVEPDSALAVADSGVVEGDSGTTALTFTVTATPAPSGPLTLAYDTADGTATAGSDYVAASGTLSFAAGQTSRTVVVAVNGDTALEENETLALDLRSPVGGDLEDSQALGRITDDDDTGCTRPPAASISTAPLLCLNRAGQASVPDAGAGAGYSWTIANGTISGGAGTAQIAFGAAAPGNLDLAVTVTNASGCTADDSARLLATPPCHGFHTLAPCRAADTRAAIGPSGGPALEANTVRSFAVAGLCNVPEGAVAVAVNVTAAGQTEPGDFRLFPTGGPVPQASVLNFVPAQPRASMALIGLGPDGRVSVQCDMAPGSTGQAHFILDVYGFFR